MILCNYGCNQKAKYQFKNGKRCCSDNVSKCPAIKKIIGEAHKGMIISQKTRLAVSKSRLGKKDSLETRKRKSEARKGCKNPIYGKRRSNKTRKKISEAVMGRPAHNKFTIELLQETYPFFSKIEEMRYNPDKPGEKEIQVHCKNHNCVNSIEKGGWFTPTAEQIYARKNSLENEGKDHTYFYCSNECKQSCPLYWSHGADPFRNINRPYTETEYQTFRTFVLERDNYICQFCGEKATYVHHEKPQKLEPFFSLDPDYAWSCCERCHYEKGHKGECSTGNLSKIVCRKE